MRNGNQNWRQFRKEVAGVFIYPAGYTPKDSTCQFHNDVTDDQTLEKSEMNERLNHFDQKFITPITNRTFQQIFIFCISRMFQISGSKELLLYKFFPEKWILLLGNPSCLQFCQNPFKKCKGCFWEMSNNWQINVCNCNPGWHLTLSSKSCKF